MRSVTYFLNFGIFLHLGNRRSYTLQI